ncbi:GntR family transcriptional regulator [Kaistia algarum]|uniref:GntR family transcriptional regulator n=1 Tax=Kaistia algarum TaxID=2083279 RepID=UPI000CE87512|nr:GntR family transcriptional regulator [Kaistia algarum]MCX5512765.1 GntR family transcriptional regulator [Kaistia algarum]PPE81735.1 GntR family transcriptional regulator [Kaistia algarum]
MARAPVPLADPTMERPLYRQLIDSLRRDIAARQPGDRIDSEPQLSRRFGVSRFTVTRAVEALVDEGLLYRRQGLGTFVAAPALTRAPSYLMSFTEAVAAAGRAPAHRVLAFGPAQWRPDLPFAEGEALVALDRLRLVDGMATAIHRSVLSRVIADRVGLTADIVANPAFSLYRRFEEAGLFVERGVEMLRARPASDEEARLLRLLDDRVVMAVRRQSFAADGTILDVVDAVYDARRYAYEAEILRKTGPAEQTTKPQPSREKDHVLQVDSEQRFGPRLGPWSDERSEGG